MAEPTKAELERQLEAANNRADAAEAAARELSEATAVAINEQLAQNEPVPSPNGSQPPAVAAQLPPPDLVGQGPAGQRRVGAHPAAAGPEGEALKAVTEVRWYRSEIEREHSAKRQGGHRWPHAAPGSVLIGTVGNSWKGESWARVVDMCDHAHNHGISITFKEFPDRCFELYDALGTMRNEIFAAAVAGGYEFCLMIDNDVLPEPDTLFRLINRDMPMIAPYVEEPEDPTTPGSARRVLHGPFREPYQGTYAVRWHVLTMMLFKTAFIGALGDKFWADSIGADEGYHFQRSYAKTGVYPFVDSDIVLEAGGAPLYPLTVRKSDKFEEFWQERRDRFNSIPERGSRYPGDPRVTAEGVYLPFARPQESTMPPELAKPEEGADVPTEQPVS